MLVPVIVGAFAITFSTVASAASITVNSLADPGAAGVCTLRDAISAANTMAATNGCAAGTGSDTVQFSVAGTILLASTLPQVKDSLLTINGPASPSITISGSDKVQVMQVASGATLNLNNLTVAHGASDANGGGIFNIGTLAIANCTFTDNSAAPFSGGGGIANGAMLTVTNSTFSGNTAFAGGAIANPEATAGTVAVSNSTFSGNTASSGGAIESDGASLTVINSTFSGNTALFGGAVGCVFCTVTNSTFFGNTAGTNGGAIASGGALTVSNSTFFGNTASSGGGINNQGGTDFKNTILADNSGGNCVAVFGSNNDAGYNISDDASCGFSKTGSANNGDSVNPLLSPAGLATNGGPTQTIALQSDSPAIDAIPLADCTHQSKPPKPITTDQRGFPRPDSGEQVCDIGAFEFQDAPIFAGQPGTANCHGVSVSALADQFGSINAAASALGFASVQALQDAISAFCKG